MDGHFVPNLTWGPSLVKQLRKATPAILDCHLMVNSPHQLIDAFCDAGANIITLHVESSRDLRADMDHIRARNVKVGLTLKPDTDLKELIPYLNKIDLALVMTVNPGFGGQAFMPDQIEKIEALADLKKEHGYRYRIQVDGGINPETAKSCLLAGADTFVAGNAVFGAKNRTQAIQHFYTLFDHYNRGIML